MSVARSLSISALAAALAGAGGCGSTLSDAEGLVVVIGGEEVALDTAEATTAAVTAAAAPVLACPPAEVRVEERAFWSTRYWRVEGCGSRASFAIARRCPPGGGGACAAKVVPISDGDPSAPLDPEMRAQSRDVIGMAYLISIGSMDLVCPPGDVLIEAVPYPTPRIVASGCRSRAEYVYEGGTFRRLDAPRGVPGERTPGWSSRPSG
jgi:hypothetical protein